MGAIVHAFYPDLWPEMAAYLANVPRLESLYVSIAEAAPPSFEREVRKGYPFAFVRRVPNRGRDVLPFLRMLELAASHGIDLVCKLHTKRSPHLPTGEAWRRNMVEKLLGSRETVERIAGRFQRDPKLGILGPGGHVMPSTFFWQRNAARVEALARRMGEELGAEPFRFVAGSMFWARVAALEPLLRLRLRDDEFEPESGADDGTLAHAIERSFPLAARRAGYEISETENTDGLTVVDFAPVR